MGWGSTDPKPWKVAVNFFDDQGKLRGEPYRQGSCADLEFKASLETSFNFEKLKKSLNCFGERVEYLEKFGICLS